MFCQKFFGVVEDFRENIVFVGGMYDKDIKGSTSNTDNNCSTIPSPYLTNDTLSIFTEFLIISLLSSLIFLFSCTMLSLKSVFGKFIAVLFPRWSPYWNRSL